MRLPLAAALFALSSVVPAQTPPWGKEVVYQVFPRSFYSAKNDHIGDIKGITEKLGYLRSLGVTALLINPIFASPVYHNYFADDFLKVDPTLGSNQDWFNLITAAHARHIKVMLDMETQYVASKNAWYVEAEKNPKSPVADYFWMRGSALFGATLGSYDGRRVGYATLNPDNPEVKKAILQVFRYWAAPDGNLRHGVDGFRIDHMMDDLDNRHVKTGMLKNFWLPVEENIRRLNPKIEFLAEQSDWKYGRDVFEGGKVDAAYAIPLRFAWISFDKGKIEDAIRQTEEATPPDKSQFVFIENHDVERYASVVDGDPALLRLGAVFDLTMKGTPLIYYGQELGMAGKQGRWGTDANDIPVRLAFRWTHDVECKGAADFYRNSGPWANTGYVRDNDGVSVEEEDRDPKSLLNFYRRLIRLRETIPALNSGSLRVLQNGNPALLSYDRQFGRQRVLVQLNLSAEPQIPTLPVGHRCRDLISGVTLFPGQVTLEPRGFRIFEIQ